MADPTPSQWKASGQLALLALAAAGALFGRTLLGPLQDSIRQSLALSDTQIAILQGPAIALPLLIVAAPLGHAIDRYSRVLLLVGLALLNVLGTLGTAVAPSFGLLFAARCLVGVTTLATPITVLSLLADLYGPDHRGRANMAMALGQAVAMGSGFALAGLALASVPAATDPWRSALLMLSFPLSFVALALMLLREPRRDTAAAPARLGEAVSALWAVRGRALPLFAALLMVGVADIAALVWAAPLFARNFALSAASVGAVLGAVTLTSGVLGPLLGGPLADWCHRRGGPRRTMGIQALLAASSAATAAFALAPDPVLAALVLGLFLTFGNMMSLVTWTLFTVLLPATVRGLAMTVVAALGGIVALGLAPPAVSLLAAALKRPDGLGIALALVSAGTSLLGVVAFLAGRHCLARASDAAAMFDVDAADETTAAAGRTSSQANPL